MTNCKLFEILSEVTNILNLFSKLKVMFSKLLHVFRSPCDHIPKEDKNLLNQEN